MAPLGFRCGLAALVALGAGALGAPAAGAGSLLGLNNDCGPASQPFAQFGDSRLYTFGANGGLESGATGWTLSGARVVRGNESYYVHSRSDRSSLSLPAGATATTPALCMGTTSTVLRYFVERSAGSGHLHVQVVLRNLAGSVLGVLDASDVSTGTSWEPAPAILNLDSLLGLVGVSSVQLRFTAVGASFGLDDVYVDPWWSRD